MRLRFGRLRRSGARDSKTLTKRKRIARAIALFCPKLTRALQSAFQRRSAMRGSVLDKTARWRAQFVSASSGFSNRARRTAGVARISTAFRARGAADRTDAL